jgi:hypothetical protein
MWTNPGEGWYMIGVDTLPREITEDLLDKICSDFLEKGDRG